MNLELWIAFGIASEIILIIPGPTIILVVSQAITHGRRSVVPLVVGVVLGDFTAMTFSLLGLGAVLALKHFSSETALPSVLFATWCVVTASILSEFWEGTPNNLQTKEL